MNGLETYNEGAKKLPPFFICSRSFRSRLPLGNAARATELATEARQLSIQRSDQGLLAHVAETEAQIALAVNISGVQFRGGGLVPSKLPPSVCPEPRFWNLAECESITRDLTGRAALSEVCAATTRLADVAVAEAQRVPMLTLDELMETSDFITLHTTLTRESRHLIGKQALARAKRGLRIVNAARGELVDEEALLASRLLEDAVSIRPGYVPSYNNLAKAYYLTGLPELAIGTYEEALRRDPSNAIALKNLAVLAEGAGLLDDRQGPIG
jgi:tetratricopeptide (TPR) repeat protein